MDKIMEICKISTPPNLFFYLSTSELSRTHRERGLKVRAHSQKKHTKHSNQHLNSALVHPLLLYSSFSRPIQLFSSLHSSSCIHTCKSANSQVH
ncbi:hypothetical protein YC2023_008874 [Brassica napus]